MVSIDDLSKLDIRVGRVIEVEEIVGARSPVFRLVVYFGEELGKKEIVAGIKASYTKEMLLDKQVVGVVNLEPKKIANVTSYGMLLAVGDSTNISLLTTDKNVVDGLKVR